MCYLDTCAEEHDQEEKTESYKDVHKYFVELCRCVFFINK